MLADALRRCLVTQRKEEDGYFTLLNNEKTPFIEAIYLVSLNIYSGLIQT